ncbi:MAG TPA: R3H domain-containing nucleic acid-binding protein [Candidatus Nanoarchaeia archaeon]
MASKTTSSKIKKEAKTLTEDFLREMSIEAEVEVQADEELIKIQISGEELGLLIGYRGENLESFQLLLGIALNKKLGLEPRLPVLVDVGGWRQQREESLRALVEKEVVHLEKGKHPVELPPMPPAQRRSIHLLVKNHGGLISESVGEEPNRYVVIKKAGGSHEK